VWGKLLGDESHLTTLDEAFAGQQKLTQRDPITAILKFAYRNPKIIYPGLMLLAEMLDAYANGRAGLHYPHMAESQNKGFPGSAPAFRDVSDRN
jgi:hypothetical protein